LKKNIIQLGKEMYFFLLLDSIALYIWAKNTKTTGSLNVNVEDNSQHIL
jgi:hypothetical protein